MTLFSPKFWVPLLLATTASVPTAAKPGKNNGNGNSGGNGGNGGDTDTTGGGDTAGGGGAFEIMASLLYNADFFDTQDAETQAFLSQPIYMCVGEECAERRKLEEKTYLRTNNNNNDNDNNEDRELQQKADTGPGTVNLEWIPCSPDAYWLNEGEILTYAYQEQTEPAPIPAINASAPFIGLFRIPADQVNANFASMPDPWFDDAQCSNVQSPFTKIGALPNQTGFYEAFFLNDQDPNSPNLPDIEASATIVGFRNFTTFLPFFNATGTVPFAESIAAFVMYSTSLPTGGPIQNNLPNGQGNPPQVLFAEMYFNSLVDWTLNEDFDNANGLATFFNLEQVLLHEAGHTLGMAHFQGVADAVGVDSDGNPTPEGQAKIDARTTVMNAAYRGGEFTTLFPQDTRGICRRYNSFQKGKAFRDNCMGR